MRDVAGGYIRRMDPFTGSALLALIINAAIAGLIIGAIARLVMPGADVMGIGMTILVGFVGSLLGGFLAGLLVPGAGPWLRFAFGVAGACIVIALMRRSRAV